MTTTTAAKRNKRVPFGVARTKLDVEQTLDGYHMHWINDDPGRLSQAMAGDYSFVEPHEVGIESADSKVMRLVGVTESGSVQNAYLMKIPMEFYLEDQSVGQKSLNQIDEAIRGGRITGSGDTTEGRYVPKEGISYKTK